ncbi:uncharacterized protein LOC100889781 [Strongylocentrotus purpuratus]|uniref:Sulfotransferase family protein n=1 Tax=Strongylocentrotus purpuratus TaxID=7668 RepID=A0A7M7LP00_STRPU|nr:uncharacterized protein LOC100889781 [Strongylocentrotus purpuratus]
MADKQIKVALWCVPRSMSTVFAKCMSAIDEMEVYLELYSYSASVSGVFHSATGRVLPKKLAGNETVYEEALAVWKQETDSILNPKRISCYDIKRDLESTKSKLVFIKEMAYITDYVQEYLPQGFKYVFLTREPTRVFTSFRKSIQASGMFHRTEGPILDIIREDPANIRPMSWYEKQHQLWKYVQEHLDPNPIIIDATDLASQPRKILKSFCEAVGFLYSDSLLQWSPSQNFPKNFVTAGENLEQFAAFYSTALSSTHFMAPAKKGPIPRDQLTDDVIRCVDYSMPFYREMYENRLQAS